MSDLIDNRVACRKTYEKRRNTLREIRKNQPADKSDKAQTWCAMLADAMVADLPMKTMFLGKPVPFCFCNNVFIMRYMRTVKLSDMTTLNNIIKQLDEWKKLKSETEISEKLTLFDEKLKELIPRKINRGLKRTGEIQGVNNFVQHSGKPFNTKLTHDSSQIISTIFHGLFDIKRQCKFRRQTALHAAVQIGWAQLCTVLLERGADMDAVDVMGQTPLHLAVSSDNQEISNVLLDHGADVNKEDNFGSLPCTLAFVNNNRKIFEMTRPKYFDINSTRNNLGKTLLCQNATMGNVDGVRTLLDLGADLTVRSTNGVLPATAALFNLHEDCFELLVTPHMVNEVYMHKTLLEHAVSKGLSKSVSLLLKLGATINTSDDEYCHPLIVLVLECLSNQNEFTLYRKKNERFQKFKEIIAVLMEHDAEFRANSSDGPLLSQYMHSQATFDLLLELGADPHVVDAENKNLLMKSIELDKSKCQTPLRTGVLIKANIDVTKMARQELNNTTASMSALDVENVFLHRMLVTAGVDFSHVSKYKDDSEIKERLLKLSAVGDNTHKLHFQVPSLQQCAELSALRLFGQGHCVKSQIEQALLPSRFRSALLKRIQLE